MKIFFVSIFFVQLVLETYQQCSGACVPKTARVYYNFVGDNDEATAMLDNSEWSPNDDLTCTTPGLCIPNVVDDKKWLIVENGANAGVDHQKLNDLVNRDYTIISTFGWQIWNTDVFVPSDTNKFALQVEIGLWKFRIDLIRTGLYGANYNHWELSIFHHTVEKLTSHIISHNDRYEASSTYIVVQPYTVRVLCKYNIYCKVYFNGQKVLEDVYLQPKAGGYKFVRFWAPTNEVSAFFTQLVAHDRLFTDSELVSYDENVYSSSLQKFAPWNCYDVPCLETSSVCSGHGQCDGEDSCCCNEGYGGNKCQYYECYGYDSSEVGMVCSGKGECLGIDKCMCNDPSLYGGSKCSSHVCNGFLYNDYENVCSGHGSCVESYNMSNTNHTCMCNDGYYGDNCEEFDCFELNKNNDLSCGDYGVCIAPDECECDVIDGYQIAGDECEYWECYGFSTNETDVCFSHGLCTQIDNCTCFNGYYGEECEYTTCYTVHSNSSLACSSNGECIGYNDCFCFDGFIGNICDEWDCFSYPSTDLENVCSGGRGECVSPDKCLCNDNYYGYLCEQYDCHDVNKNNLRVVCSGHGVCINHNNCSCDDDYYGDNCEYYECNKVQNDNIDNVCNGNGKCHSPNNCTCFDGYYGEYCDLYDCFIEYTTPYDTRDDVLSTYPTTNLLCYLKLNGNVDDDTMQISAQQSNVTFNYHDRYFQYPNTVGSFNGHSSYINLGPILHNKVDFTISFWVKTLQKHNVTPIFNNPAIIGTHQRGAEMSGDFVVLIVNGYLSFYDEFGDGESGEIIVTNSFVSDYCWHFVIIERRSNPLGDIKIYVDGDLVGERSPSTTSLEVIRGDLYVGKSTFDVNSLLFEGFLDDLFVFDDAISFGDLISLTNYSFNPSKQSILCGNYKKINPLHTQQCSYPNGTCVGHNKCECISGFYGIKCQFWTCFDLPYNDTRVCSNRGECLSLNRCKCDNYDVWGGDNCHLPVCFDVRSDNENVCSGHGECLNPNECFCSENYFGRECNNVAPNVTYTCYGKRIEDLSVCSGYGRCIEQDSCQCYNGFEGNKCQKLKDTRSSGGEVFYITMLSILGILIVVVIIVVLIVVISFFSVKYLKKRQQENNPVEARLVDDDIQMDLFTPGNSNNSGNKIQINDQELLEREYKNLKKNNVVVQNVQNSENDDTFKCVVDGKKNVNFVIGKNYFEINGSRQLFKEVESVVSTEKKKTGQIVYAIEMERNPPGLFEVVIQRSDAKRFKKLFSQRITKTERELTSSEESSEEDDSDDETDL